MANPQKKGALLDFIAKKKAEQMALPGPDSASFTTDVHQATDTPPPPAPKQVFLPPGLPSVQPERYTDPNANTYINEDQQGLAGRLRAIATKPVRTLNEFVDIAKKGNPVAAGLHLGNIVPEIAFAVPMAAEETAREWGPTKAISDAMRVPFKTLGEGIDHLRKTVQEQVKTPAGQAYLRMNGIDPSKAEEIIDEAFGIGQQTAAIAAFGAAGKYATKGAISALGANAERIGGMVNSVGKFVRRKTLSEAIDEQLMQKATGADKPAPLPDLPPGGIPAIDAPPGDRGFIVSPQGVAMKQPPLALPEGRSNIGGFMLEPPKTALTKNRMSPAEMEEARKLYPNVHLRNDAIPPLLEDGVHNVIRESGYDARFDGYYKHTNSLAITDNLTGSSGEVPFGDFNAKSVSAKIEQIRKPFYEEAEARGVTLEKYISHKDAGTLDQIPKIEKPMTSEVPKKPRENSEPESVNQAGDQPAANDQASEAPPAPAKESKGIQSGLTQEDIRLRTLSTPQLMKEAADLVGGREKLAALLEKAKQQAIKEEYDFTDRKDQTPGTAEGVFYENVAEQIVRNKGIPEHWKSVLGEEPAAAPKKKSPVIKPIKGEGQTAWVNIKDIVTRLGDFQEREKPYAESTVESIVNAVKTGKFIGREKLPPIDLWQDPKTGELVVVSGHSRTEAYRRLAAEGKKDFNEISARVFKDMTLEEAKATAAVSNLGAQATPVEKANAVRAMRQAGMSEKDIEAQTRNAHQKQTPQIIKLSRLEPTGKAIDAVRTFVEKGEATSAEGRDVMTMAEWIGDLKRKYPELTLRHENEIFDFLKKNYKTVGKKIKSEADFNRFMKDVIEKRSVLGQIDESLNFDQLQPLPISRERIAAEFDERIGELTAGLNKKNALISRKQQTYEKKGLPQEEIDNLLRQDRAEREVWERDLAKEIVRKEDAMGALKRSELNLFEQDNANPSYLDALKETKKRFNEKGILPDPDKMLGSVLPVALDAEKIAYILDPIVKKMQADAIKLVDEGSIRREDVMRWINRGANDLLSKNEQFRNLSTADKQAMFKALREKFDRMDFDPAVGRFFEQSRKQYDESRRQDRDTMKKATEEQGGNPNMPSLKYDDGSPALYNSKNLSHTPWGRARRLLFTTMGKYVSNQTVFGEHLVESLNFVDRRAGQWAESYLLEYGKRSKKLSDKEFDEFVTLANDGGTSSHAGVQDMLEWWRASAKEIITRAKEAGLETSYAQITKDAFGKRDINVVTRPIGERENYFPHEYEWKKLMDTDSQKSFIESIAKREGISLSEAAALYNKYLKHRSEMKYGNLEKPRLTGDNNWSRGRDVIPSYIERSTRRIMTAEVLGRKNANAISMIDKISEHGGDAWAAKELLDRWLGADYPTNSAGAFLYELSKKTGSWQVATKLQLLFLLNPTQMNNTGLLFGHANLMRGIMQQVGDFNKWRDFAHRAAAITDQTVAMHMKEAMSLEGIGGKVMDWTGVKIEERILRGNAAATGAAVLERWGKDLGNNTKYKETAALLRILQLDKQIDIAKVKQNGGFTKQQLLDIGFEAARSTQFLTRPQDMPTFFSTPEMRLFNQFKSFSVQQTALVWRMFKEMPPRQKVRALAALGITYPVSGAIVSSVRDGIHGRQRDESNLEAYIRATATVGSMGILYDMLMQSSYNQQGFNAYFAGPTMGDISRLVYGLRNPQYLPGTLSSQIPFPGVQQVMENATDTKKDKGRTRDEKPQRERKIRQ